MGTNDSNARKVTMRDERAALAAAMEALEARDAARAKAINSTHVSAEVWRAVAKVAAGQTPPPAFERSARAAIKERLALLDRVDAEERAHEEADRERARDLRKVLATLDTRDPREASAHVTIGMLSGGVPFEAMRALRSIARGADPGDLSAARTAINARLADLGAVEGDELQEELQEHPVEPEGDEEHPVEPPHPLLSLDGLTVTADADAAHAARAAKHAAEHGAPLDARELARRLDAAPDASARNAVALDPEVLRAAALLQTSGEAFEFAELRRVVKGARVSLATWDDGVRREAERLRADEERAVEELRRASAARTREAEERAREAREAAEREALEARRRAAGEDLAGYVNTFETVGGITFETEPGCMTATVPNERPDGTPGRPKVRDLMNAAPRILSVIEEQEQPEGDRAAWFRVGFALRAGAPFAVDVPAQGFNTCAWITPATHGRVILAPGRDVPDLVRVGINATREGAPTILRRAFLGWVHDAGRWMRVHAAGAIGAEGTIPGVEVRVPERKLQRYAHPEVPEGEARFDALDALRELVTLEPADAVLPVVAFVVRSMIGPGAGVCHVHGGASTGKSHLAALALCLAGEGFEGPRSLPGEWERDTPGFTAKALAVAGDTPWGVDDWRPGADPGGVRFLEVARAVFNMSGRGALSRARGFNATMEPRGSVLSTGEAIPSGGSWSGLSRVLAVELAARVELPGGTYAPGEDDEEPERAFTVRAPMHLARAGSLLCQWLAPRLDAWRDPAAPSSRKRLVAAERAALARWGVRESARAVDVIGPAALGAEVLAAFLRESGAMDAHALGALDARFRAALAGLAGERRATLDAHAPGKAWCDALAALVRAGRAHVAVVKGGRITPSHPEGAEVLGWRYRNGAWEAQGPTVAHLDARHPGALCVDPAVALGAVADELRRRGRAPEIESKEHLSRELAAAGLLAERTTAKRAALRTRVNGFEAHRLAVALGAFGLDSNAPDNGPDNAPEGDA